MDKSLKQTHPQESYTTEQRVNKIQELSKKKPPNFETENHRTSAKWELALQV
jgi:hypothetical protein